MSMWRGSSVKAFGAVLLVLAGCTSATRPVSARETGPKVTGPTLSWSKVVLPPGVEPVTLAASGRELLVGGLAATGRVRPRLLRISADGSGTEVPLIPHSGYAFDSRWRSIASDGNRIIAVGGAPGGAHSNTRWTTWTGTTKGVAEVPQPFDTFGGWGAGDVIGPVLTTVGPVIAGTWGGARAGLDAAIWLPAGDSWVRQPSAATALESTPALLVGPRSATSDGASVVLPGSALHLANGTVRQSAAVWRSQRLGDGWTRVDIPDSGATGEAVSARCASQSCVVVGYVDNALALWRVSKSTVVPLHGVPHLATNPHTPIPGPLLTGAAILTGAKIIEVVSTGPNVVVLAGSDRHWALSRGPVGQATTSALVGGWVYVISRSAVGPAVLWRFPVKDLG